MGRFSFKLPDVGEGIAEAEIVAWHVGPGDRIEEDQPFIDVMTDKATVEITSPVSGSVVSVEGEAGSAAAVGSVVAVLEVDGVGDNTAVADPPSPPAVASAQASGPGDISSKPPPPATAAPAARTPVVPRVPGTRPLASPAVRRRALELGVRLAEAPGTGPAGRITHQDLDAFLAGARPDSAGRPLARREGEEQVKVIGLRRRISERMSEAKRRIPHFSYVEEVDVSDLETLRAQLNGAYQQGPKLTVLPFITRALVRALSDFPQINATFDDEAAVVTRHAPVHLGIATQTPGGLVVPVLRHAEALDPWEIAVEIARLAEAARSGKATSAELSGSTITVTSLGPLGGLATTPVINRPEVAIVGPNRIIERPVVREGAVVVRKVMNLSCSFDHRVVDGWDAAEFVQRLKRLLEAPALLLVERT
jgi:2-oxoisovalerate dehydrogenase E2 component (dihydrolipoyl transacylase)